MAEETNKGIMDRLLDLLEHQNDKRVVVFVLGIAALGWLGSRPQVNMEVIQYVAGLTALAILGISLRPEKSQLLTLPAKPVAQEPTAPEAASASVEPPKQP